MLIPLDKIKPSPHPVRTSWDEDKMNELAQSIKEQGLIVPIKVRAVCPTHGQEFLDYEYPRELSDPAWDGARVRFETVCRGEILDEDGEKDECHWANDLAYEIVYGHRRVEACKRVGLGEVEAWVEGVDDNTAHTMAGIENLVREGMKPFEVAEWVKSENDKGKSLRKIATMVGKQNPWAVQYLQLLKQPAEVRKIAEGNPGNIKERHIRVVRLNVEPEEVAPILEKVVKEDLVSSQAEKIAMAIKEAPTPQAKKRLLEWEYSPTIHDPELIRQRKEKHGAHDPIYRDNKPSPQKAFDDSPEIKMLLDAMTTAIQTFIDLMVQIQTVTEIGKLAPEGRQFMAHKLRSFRNKIDNLLAELED